MTAGFQAGVAGLKGWTPEFISRASEARAEVVTASCGVSRQAFSPALPG